MSGGKRLKSLLDKGIPFRGGHENMWVLVVECYET